MAKKITYSLVSLTVLLVLINYLYKRYLFEQDLQKHSEVINLARNIPDDCDLVYVGESSNITNRSDDLDRRPISDFIGDYYPDLVLYDITKPAGHAGIFKYLLPHIPEDTDIGTVIVTLNLRSFNAQWIYSELETALQKSMVLLRPNPPLFNRFLLSFKAYDIKNAQEREEQFKRKWRKDRFDVPGGFEFRDVIEWDAHMWQHGVKNPDGTKNEQLSVLACHYIKAYAFQIDTLSNPRIRDFNEIVELAEERNWNLVFNLMAENTRKAGELVGEDLLFFMEQNRQLLKDYYSSRGVLVVDNLHAVEDEQFIDQNWTTEHYAEKGRKTIARNVALAIEKFHPGQYAEVNYEERPGRTFFNNCDEGVDWGQMQTLSDEAAFSGSHSSRTGKGNDFSITFEYSYKSLASRLKNRIIVSARINQRSLDHDAKMVLEALGEQVENSWMGIEIHPQVSTAGEWMPFSHTFLVNENTRKADLVKIYLYNPTDKIIYIDDLKIDFE